MQAKVLCNASAKQEMFSLKQALAAIKNAYDAKSDGVREYITDTLGIGAKRLKDLKWSDLQEYAKAGKTGRYSTWAVLNALPKWYAAVGGNMEKEDILEQWTSYRGVIFANLKAGVPMPTQISTNATNIGTNELLALQLQLVRDISGVHGAMLGKEAKSGTAASLYAQEASNAQTNLLDTIESFAAFRKRRDYKIAKVIPQCYDYVDYIPVAGKDYSDAAKEWNAALASKFDYYILIAETNNSELYQAQLNQLLMAALQQRLIDFKTALEVGRFPFGDQVLRLLERKEQEMQQQQAQQQAMVLQGQAAGLQMADQGASQAEIAQAGADMATQALANENALQAQAGQADPRAMEMIQTAIGGNV